MIEKILPSGVASADHRADVDTDTLFPEERLRMAKAVDKRRREFSTVRYCARRALGELGLPPVAILPGTRGAPQWPAGVTGAMTHCDGFRAAAVGHADAWFGLGIDAELDAPLPDGILDAVSLPGERRHLRECAALDPTTPWDRLLFSAKESVFKVWYPVMHSELGFDDAAITFGPDRFSVRLLVPGPFTVLEGRWLRQDGVVLTAIALDSSLRPVAETTAAPAERRRFAATVLAG